MLDSLRLTPRTTKYGAGIYEAGNTEECYVKLFVTDTGRVLPVNHRVITEDDLLEVYVWGRLDERAADTPITEYVYEASPEAPSEPEGTQ